MKCLSLWQPWASLMVHGLKRVETRSWQARCPRPLLIHAAKTWSPELAALCLNARLPFMDALRSMGCRVVATKEATGSAFGLPLGCIVGRVVVVNCFRTERVTEAASNPAEPYVTEWSNQGGPDNLNLRISELEHAFGDYSAGRFAWLCRNPVSFGMGMAYSGSQGLFDVPDELIPKDAMV